MFWFLCLIILVTPVLVVIAWYNLSPQFGERPNQIDKAKYAQLEYHNKKTFQNSLAINMKIDLIPTMIEWLRKDPKRKPPKDLIPVDIKPTDLSTFGEKPILYWFGHSAFLVVADGQKFLIDPMFGQHSSPHPWLGTKRYSSKLPLDFEEFPEIDFALITHDHYDHLDYDSVQRLKNKIKLFVVPLGLKKHLIRWGVISTQIKELKWHEDFTHNSIKATLTPARHFSGRGLFDRSETLWGSWVIQTSNCKIYFSGDSGYGPHFKEIGNQYGPFDLTLMECGQYNEAWKDVHMMPEESVQAAEDLGTSLYMPIHWAGFTLSFHSWVEPVERSLSQANEKGLKFISPQIGEKIDLNSNSLPQSNWWQEI